MFKLCRESKLIAVLIGVFISGQSSASNLIEIFELAVANDPVIRAAEARMMSKVQSESIQRAPLLPQVSAQARYQKQRLDFKNDIGDADLTTSGYAASITQVIFDLPTWYRYKQSGSISRQAELQFQSALQELSVRSAQAYFNVLRAVDDLINIEAEEKASKFQLRQAEQQFDSGVGDKTDVLEAQAAFDEVAVRVFQARANLGIQFEAITALTGQRLESVAALKKDFPIRNPEPESAEEWVKIAVDNNFSLADAEHARQAAQFKLKARSSEHLPSVNLGVNYLDGSQRGDFGAFTVPADGDTSNILLSLTVPLYSGGVISSQRRQAEYQYTEADENLAATRREVVQKIRSLHLGVRLAVSTVKARERAVSSFENAFQATQAGYVVGTRNLVDVLNAERALFQGQRDYLNARYDYIIAYLKLRQSAGILKKEDILRANDWVDDEDKLFLKVFEHRE